MSVLDGFLGLTTRPLTAPNSTTLPQYLLEDYGEIFEAFDDVTEWTADAGSAADNATAGEFRTGDHSIKITSGVGTNAQITKTLDTPITFSSGQHMRLYYFVHDYANLASVNIALLTTANQILIIGGADLENNNPPGCAGWNVADSYPDESIGDATWSSTFNRIRVVVNPKDGVAASVSFDLMRIGLVGTAAILWAFDDAAASVYNQAYAYMNNIFGRGTFYIYTAQVAVEANVTAGQLREMQATGWSIANHTRSHAYGLGYAAELADIQNGKADLTAWGLTNAANHFAFPGGGYSVDILQAVSDAGMLTARPTSKGYPILDAYFDQKYMIPISHAAAEGVVIEDWQGYIDDAILYGRVIVAFCHNVGVGLEFEPATFRAIVDYAYSKGLPFITVEDLYDALSGPVTVQKG